MCLAVLDSDSYELHIEEVKFDAQAAQYYSDRAVSIIADTNARSLAPRVSDDPNYFSCRFCDYSDVCHSGANPLLREDFVPPQPLTTVSKMEFHGGMRGRRDKEET